MGIMNKTNKNKEEEILEQDSKYEGVDPEEEVLEQKERKLPQKKLYIALAGTLVVVGLIGFIGKSMYDSKNAKEPFSDTATKSVDANGFISDKGASGENQGSEQTDPDLSISYNDDQKSQLRSAGYTGDDIEKAQQDLRSFKEMMDNAKKEKSDYLKALYTELSDNALSAGSEEYKTLIDETWLSGDPKTITYKKGTMFDTEAVTYNASFIKIPLRGAQCFLRLTLDDGSYIFYNVHPDRYAQLKEKGNMVVTYNKVKYDENSYILDIKEKPIK